MTQHILVTALLMISSQALAKLEYTSNDLRMTNTEVTANRVNKKIKKAADVQADQKDEDVTDGISVLPEAIDNLKDGMRIAFSLPDPRDGICTKLFAQLRRELTDLNSFDKTFESLADEAIAQLKTPPKDPKRAELMAYFTYVYILKNMVAEMSPELENTTFKKVTEKIRDADIKIPDKVQTQWKMQTGLSAPESPSVKAKENLKAKK